MDVEEEVRALLAQTSDLDNDSYYVEAAQSAKKAYELACSNRLTTLAREAGLMAANMYVLSSQFSRAIALYLDVLEDDPARAVTPEEFKAYHFLLVILGRLRPNLLASQRRIDRLEQIASADPNIPFSLVHHSRYFLLFAQGLFEEALKETELAYSKREQGESGLGWANYARDATYLCLELGRPEEARRWCDLVEEHGLDLPWHWVDYGLMCSELRLYAGDPAAIDDWQRADELAECMSHINQQMDCVRVGVACTLVEESQLDPRDPAHPAPGLLRRRLTGTPDPVTRFKHALSLCDYRLASVRYSAGLPRCEDRWYTRPQVVPSQIHVVDRAEFASRLERACRALRRAMVQARRLDRAWQCNFRQAWVRARWARLEEIAHAAGFPLSFDALGTEEAS